MSMSNKFEVTVVEQEKRSNATWYAAASALAVTALAPMASQAAELTAIGAELDSELDAGKLIIVAIMTLGATLLAMFAGYRYMKRGANSA